MLNIDTKILSKAISNKLKTAVSTLIAPQETGKRFIGENGRLISDIIETSSGFNITGFLITMDIEKAFDSLGPSFLISVLKKLGFGKKKHELDRNLIQRSTIVCHNWWNDNTIFYLKKRCFIKWLNLGVPFHNGDSFIF